MMRRRLGALAALLLCLLLASPARAVEAGRYGNAVLLRPHGAPTGFVILFSAGPAWAPADQRAAETLVAKGAIVLGVDRAAYVARLDKASCHELVGDADGQSKRWQRIFGVAIYHAPILAGFGQGGRLAQLALTEAPAHTVGGAISVDPEASPGLTSPPCPRDPAASDHLLGFWDVGLTPAAPAAGQAWIAAETKAGRGPVRRNFAAGTTETDLLTAMIGPHLGQSSFRPQDVRNLPLVELPASPPSDMLAVVLSGDGGWRDIDKTIAEKLHADGVNVVGWDSLHYFWQRKTPEETARDLARVIAVYSARWHAAHVALIGYSFGADVLPFLYNRLPEQQRREVAVMSLLGFADAADFEIHITGWLGMPPTAAALPVAPEMAKIPGRLVQCFYGADETDSDCQALAKSGATLVRTGGGHHFGHDYDAMAARILEGWRKRDGGQP